MPYLLLPDILTSFREFMNGEVASKVAKEEPQVEETTPARSKEPGVGRARPVMVHRAIVGSFERFLGILIVKY